VTHMCRPRHKEAGVKSAHRQRPRSTRTPVHADPLCACPTPHPGIYRGALRTCCTITCTVATCCYPISFITSIMIIQACATIHRRRRLQQLEPRPRCVPCGKCRAHAEDAWHAIATGIRSNMSTTAPVVLHTIGRHDTRARCKNCRQRTRRLCEGQITPHEGAKRGYR